MLPNWNVVHLKFNDQYSSEQLISMSAETPVKISGWGMTEDNIFDSYDKSKYGKLKMGNVRFVEDTSVQKWVLVLDPSSQTAVNRIWPRHGDSGCKL